MWNFKRIVATVQKKKKYIIKSLLYFQALVCIFATATVIFKEEYWMNIFALIANACFILVFYILILVFTCRNKEIEDKLVDVIKAYFPSLFAILIIPNTFSWFKEPILLTSLTLALLIYLPSLLSSYILLVVERQYLNKKTKN